MGRDTMNNLQAQEINAFSYSRLLPVLPSGEGEVAETKYPYLHVTERHLQVMWLEQKYFKNLVTEEGLSIEVISPGIWNSEAGPDFLKAHVRIGSQDVKGDVELHLSEDGWTRHGHHLDPRYQGVVLHLSLWTPKVMRKLLTVNGKRIYQSVFEGHLTISINHILKLIDLDLYPYRKCAGTGKCAGALFRSEEKARVMAFFQSAADWRLFQKREYLAAKVEDPRCMMGAGIAMALGYKENAEPFFELFIRLLKYRRFSEEEIFALSLGMCGFFEEKFQKKWKESEKYRHLFKKFEDLSMPYSIKLSFGRIRPLNHPIRRLVYLSKLMRDNRLTELEEMMGAAWKESWHTIGQKRGWKELKQRLLDLIPVFEDSFWNSHFTFIDEAREEFLPLIGQNLMIEILINTFLPLLQKSIFERANEEEIHAFHDFYRSLPALKSKKMLYLSNRFFGNSPKGEMLKKADCLQGAIQLHRDFCTRFETSCEGCDFVEKYVSDGGKVAGK